MTILIVEDDASIADTLEIFLKDAGYPVLKCATVQNAVAILTGIKIDLILLDLLLDTEKSFSVIEFCQAKLQQSPKIIIMSAWRQCHEIAKRYNIENCLDKPFNIERLEHMINS